MGRVGQGFDLVGACRRRIFKHAGVCSLRERRLPRRISRPYGQCRRAAFMKQRYFQFDKVSAVSVVVLAGAVVVSVAVVVVVASFKQLCVTAGSGEPAVT